MRAKCLALMSIASVSMAMASVGAASAVEESKAESGRSSAAMTVGGIDLVQAQKAGNSVSVRNGRMILQDGHTGEVLANIPSDPTVAKRDAVTGATEKSATPNNTVIGNCGSSYMWIADAPGDHSFQISTGFDINGTAYDFGWETRVSNEHLNWEWSDYGPMAPASTWESGWILEEDEGVPGYTHEAAVLPGSAAFLTDGRMCYAYEPTAASVIW